LEKNIFFIPNQETKFETKEKRKKQKQLFCIQQLEISFFFLQKQMFCFYCNFFCISSEAKKCRACFYLLNW
jgi:hypothetical protein